VGLIAGISVGVLAILIVLVAALMDWNAFRGPLSRVASERLGRPVRIDGDLEVRLLSLTPSFTVNGLDIGNPKWAGGGSMARAERVSVQVKLLPLFKGSIVLPSVRIQRPEVHLLRAADGRANWTPESTGKPSNGEPPNLPVIQRFQLDSGEITYKDVKRQLDFKGVAKANETTRSQDARPFQFTGSGTMNGEPFKFELDGAPLVNVERDKPYPFEARVIADTARVSVRGSIPKPFDLSALTADVDLSGDDLSDLYYISGLAFPNTPPYRITGHLERKGTKASFKNLSGKVGDSDMRGDVFVDLGHDRPFVQAKVSSRTLDLDDVAAWFGAGPATKKEGTGSAKQPAAGKAMAATQQLFPDAKLKAARVRAMDAHVQYEAEAVRSGRFPIRAASMIVKLDAGVLKLEPVSLSMPHGKIEGTVRIDASHDVAKTDIDARLLGVELEQFKSKKNPVAPFGGVLRGRVKLAGRGNSVHEFVASSDGAATFVVPRGEVREALAELTGINVARGLGLLLSKDQVKAGIRCGVADLKATDGTLAVQNLVVDTDNVLITGKGDVTLGDEQFDLEIKGQPKKLRLFRLKSPIAVRGPLRKPSVGLKADEKSLGQSGVAAALGALVAPLAAVVAFVDPGLAKDADCASLLAEAKSQGAPVKTAEVQNAPRR
jgi:uncharacterized protein involved in outer membrane biogenesis